MRTDRWAAASAPNANSMQNNNVLSARGIGKSVKSGTSELVILREIDLAVTRGEAVAVGGASGAGEKALRALLGGPGRPPRGAAGRAGTAPLPRDEGQR